MAYGDETNVKVGEKEITIFRIEQGSNGGPRYGVWYGSLDLDSAEPNKCTRAAGFYQYRGKKYGGIFTFSSYYPQGDLPKMYARLHDCLNKPSKKRR